MGEALGFGCAAIAVVFFGSNMLPVKQFKTGDGVMFQWVMCCAIWVGGLGVQIIRGSPQFEPLAMIGGMLWATGNAFCVPVIQCIGLGLGILIWGGSNLLMGWASGKFGFFGIKKQSSNNETLNILGVVCSFLSLFVFFFVRTVVKVPVKTVAVHDASYSDVEHGHRSRNGELLDKTSSPTSIGSNDDDHDHGNATTDNGNEYDADTSAVVSSDTPHEPLLVHHHRDGSKSYRSTNDSNDSHSHSHSHSDDDDDDDSDGRDNMFTRLPATTRRILGTFLAVLAGSLFGLNFDPPQYLIDHPDWHDRHHSDHALDYVFSHFCGILVTSTMLMIGYSIARGNRPKVYPKVIAPAFVSGLMWAVAQTAWFVANQELSFVVAFPIVTTGPGIVAALWGVFMFHEIRGKRNFLILAAAGFLTILGVTLITLSKVE
jgi:glucose uptake protein GlcU